MNILLVDDQGDVRRSLAEFLRELGHRVTEAAAGSQALTICANEELHLVISDIMMPGISGLELLRQIRSLPAAREVEVVLITGYGDVKTAVQALRYGACDYLLKPVDVEELAGIVERRAEHLQLRRENAFLTHRFREAVAIATQETRQELDRVKKAYLNFLGLHNIGVFSPAMDEVFNQAGKLHSDRSIPVLIEGETGTGKEVVARYIHFGPGSTVTPFVDLNCAAIPPAMFESELFGYEAGTFTGGLPGGRKGKLDLAQGGTLFLDEIAEIPVDLQAKLLRFIQEKEYYRVGGLKKIPTDVRIICATNVDLQEKVTHGSFRQDLYYRLNVGRIHLPPLRERQEDILPLARMFLAASNREKKKRIGEINLEAEKIILAHPWPGNVRELKNAMEWAVLMGEDGCDVSPSHLGILAKGHRMASPLETHVATCDWDNLPLPPKGLSLEKVTQRIVLGALHLKNGNKTEAARYLGISRRSLDCRLKHYL